MVSGATQETVVAHVLATNFTVPVGRFNSKRFIPTDWTGLARATKELHFAPLWIATTHLAGPAALAELAQRIIPRKPAEVAILLDWSGRDMAGDMAHINRMAAVAQAASVIA